MKVVIDANIIISAYIWRGKPGLVFDRVLKGLDDLFVTDDLVDEIEDNKRKPKFSRFQGLIDSAITDIRNYAHKVTILPRHKAAGATRDPKDDKYLECALAAGADFIISGDIHLRELKEYKGVKIVNAAEYLEIVAPEKSQSL